jgi:propionyl-CoA carboxylase alpha chain
MRNHARSPGRDWVVALGGHRWPVTVARESGGSVVEIGGERLEVASDWRPGATLVRAQVGGQAMTVKAGPAVGGWRLRWRGADLRVSVLSPRHAELAARLPEKAPPDTSKALLCPMPGLVVRIDVAEGDEVFDGQALCMVEAMKMENVLRAERRARVAKVHATPGQSLAVDDVIMEFE